MKWENGSTSKILSDNGLKHRSWSSERGRLKCIIMVGQKDGTSGSILNLLGLHISDNTPSRAQTQNSFLHIRILIQRLVSILVKRLKVPSSPPRILSHLCIKCSKSLRRCVTIQKMTRLFMKHLCLPQLSTELEEWWQTCLRIWPTLFLNTRGNYKKRSDYKKVNIWKHWRVSQLRYHCYTLQVSFIIFSKTQITKFQDQALSFISMLSWTKILEKISRKVKLALKLMFTCEMTNRLHLKPKSTSLASHSRNLFRTIWWEKTIRREKSPRWRRQVREILWSKRLCNSRQPPKMMIKKKMSWRRSHSNHNKSGEPITCAQYFDSQGCYKFIFIITIY